LYQLARSAAVRGDPNGVAVALEALEAARQLGLRDLETAALNSLGIARVNHGDREGLHDVERSLDLAKEIHLPTEIARANGNIASLTLEFGEVARSFEAHLAAVEAAERWGLARATTWFRGERPEYDYHAGRWDDAQRHADAFIAEIEAGSPHYQEPSLRVF